MSNSPEKNSGRVKIPALEVVLIAQIFFTTLFVGKIAADFFAIPLYFLPWNVLEMVEILASVGMLAGVISSVLLIRASRSRVRQVEEKIEATAGELQAYLERQFAEWCLTQTEKQIALLVIKGFSNLEIAQLRGTTESTVKSQMTAIFRKSGVSSRQQLVSWVIEDLLEALAPMDDRTGLEITTSA